MCTHTRISLRVILRRILGICLRVVRTMLLIVGLRILLSRIRWTCRGRSLCWWRSRRLKRRIGMSVCIHGLTLERMLILLDPALSIRRRGVILLLPGLRRILVLLRRRRRLLLLVGAAIVPRVMVGHGDSTARQRSSVPRFLPERSSVGIPRHWGRRQHRARAGRCCSETAMVASRPMKHWSY